MCFLQEAKHSNSLGSCYMHNYYLKKYSQVQQAGEQTHLDIIESYNVLVLKFLEKRREGLKEIIPVQLGQHHR